MFDLLSSLCLALTLLCIFLLLYWSNRKFQVFDSIDARIFAAFSGAAQSFADGASSDRLFRFNNDDDIEYQVESRDTITIDPEKESPDTGTGGGKVYPCTPHEPRKCKKSITTSCFGCASLTSRCIHFDEDTDYYDANGEIRTLNRNKDKDDGYCLDLGTIVEKCNLYHGRYTLVYVTATKNYALICSCLDPGYVGKNNLLGACDTPFICNGKVKDINRPLSKIECDCEKGTSHRLLGYVPTCQPLAISEVQPGDDFLWKGKDNLVSKEVFNIDIRGNYKGDYLPNPCGICPLTNRRVNGRVFTDPISKVSQCVSNEGVPIRRNPDWRLLNGDEGPDAVLAITPIHIDLYGYIDSTEYTSLGIRFNRDEEIFRKLGLKDSEAAFGVLYLDGNRHQVKFPGNFDLRKYHTAPNIHLHLHGFFRYDNYFVNPEYSGWNLSYYEHNIRQYVVDKLPGIMMSGGASWKIAQQEMKPLLKFKYINGLPMAAANKVLLQNTAEAKAYRFAFFRFHPFRAKYEARFLTKGDWMKFKSTNFLKLGE